MLTFFGHVLTYGVKFVFELAVIVAGVVLGKKYRDKKDAQNGTVK